MRVDLEPSFILHTRAYRETSLLVDALSERHGRVGLLARGVRSARGQPVRALLQPLQPVLLSWTGRGELPLLRSADAAGTVPKVSGDAVLAGFYVNELLLRLLPRDDPHPLLFQRYAVLLGELTGPRSLAWTLRRFERDLLEELGYALVLEHDAEGGALQPQARYRYDPDLGPVALGSAGSGGASISGAALLAFAADEPPDEDELGELRRMMRRVLRERLGGRELQAWRTWPRFRPRSAANDAED